MVRSRPKAAPGAPHFLERLFPLLGAIGLVVIAPACQSATPPAPIADELKNLTYRGIMGMDGPVTLSGGRWEGAPYADGGASRPSVFLVRQLLAVGDLDGDGADEAVALLSYSSGGTGEFMSVAVVARRKGLAENVATAALGDRVKVRGARVEHGTLVLDVLRAGPSDAMCCPLDLATLTYRLEGGTLRRIGERVTGRLPEEGR